MQALAVALVLVLLLLLLFYYAPRTERFWGGTDRVSGEDLFSEYSPYGNISLQDIDQLANQRVVPAPSDESRWNALDNSDVVRATLGIPGAVFQPNQQGVTPTTYGGLASFQMGEPGRRLAQQIPQTGLLDADEVAARKQQHTSSMNKRALDGAVRSTADLYRLYFSNELAEAEGTDWWDAEAATFETDYDPST